MFQAWVRVITPDYSHWNRLGVPHLTREQAEAEIASYHEHKRNGTGGFRKGAPAPTKVERA